VILTFSKSHGLLVWKVSIAVYCCLLVSVLGRRGRKTKRKPESRKQTVRKQRTEVGEQSAGEVWSEAEDFPGGVSPSSGFHLPSPVPLSLVSML